MQKQQQDVQGGNNSFYKTKVKEEPELQLKPLLITTTATVLGTTKNTTTIKYRRPITLADKVDEYFRQSDRYPQASIHDSYITVGGYALLLRSANDILFSRYHPGVLDGSLKIEFVTSKTNTNATMRFLKRQTTEYGYYYSCLHCYDLSGKSIFRNIDDYDRHIVIKHKPRTVGYPGPPDIEKLELERVKRKQGNNKCSKTAAASAANLADNGVLRNGHSDTTT
ncbi:MAG: hypothetical protein ACRD8W_12335 [Nitrososphaeraceae archaeon]